MKKPVNRFFFLVLPSIYTSLAFAQTAATYCQLESSSLGPKGSYQLAQCAEPPAQEASSDFVSRGITDVLCFDQYCTSKEKVAVEGFVRQVNPSKYGSTHDVAASNAGLSQTIKDKIQTRDPGCFGALAFRFYNDRTLLTRVEGSSDLNADSQKGYIWERALRFSGGDQNLALALIGSCGHDDAGTGDQKNFVYCMDNADREMLLKSPSKEQSEKCVNQKNTATGLAFSCPSNVTGFYRQGGLTGVEIPSELKSKLSSAHGLKQEYLPHKYYHVLGSAFLTCQMIERGVTAKKAAEIEKITSLLYRSVRVCEASRKNMANFNAIIEEMKNMGQEIEPIDFKASSGKWIGQWNKVRPKIVSYMKKKNYMDLRPYGINVSEITTKEDRDALNQKIENYPGIVLAGYLTHHRSEKLSNASVQKRLAASYGEGHEYFLGAMKALTSKTDSFEMRTAMKVLGKLSEGVKNFSDISSCISNALLNYAIDHKYTCSEFQSDCAMAQAKLKTYQADFLQTSAYHEMGEDFAKKNCKPGKSPDQSFKSGACVALGKLRSTPDLGTGKSAPSENGKPKANSAEDR